MNKQKQPCLIRRDRIIKVEQLGDDGFSELSRSEYSMKDVLEVDEFRSLSKQIRLNGDQESKLVDSFYYPQWKPNQRLQRAAEAPSKYWQDYSKWKGEGSKEDAFKSTYTSTLALLNKQQQQHEVERLLQQYSIDQAILSYSHQSPLLHINQDYSQSLASITHKQRLESSKLPASTNYPKDLLVPQASFQSHPVTSWRQSQIAEQNQQKQAIIELQVQQQLLNRLKQINQEQKQEQLQAKRQRQLKKTCFKQLIARPPHRKSQKTSPQKQIIQSAQQFRLSQQGQHQQGIANRETNSPIKQRNEKKARYRLNVDQILKIPHRLFLIFYSQNYHQIVRLSSPQDLKRINQYRSEALRRQQAVEILKKKVADEGSDLVSQLPSGLKQKLFKVLYDQDIEQEKYAQGHY